MPLIDAVYRINKDVFTEKLETGIAISKVGTKKLLVLNSTGSAIWNRLDGKTPITQIIDALATQFGQSPDVISKEVYSFTDRLLIKGLIVKE